MNDDVGFVIDAKTTLPRLITAFRASRGVPPTERDESFAQRPGASSRDVVVVKHLPDREIVVLHQQQFRSRRFQLKEAFDRRPFGFEFPQGFDTHVEHLCRSA
ncbi:MAG: hypothetical protein DMF85_21720 [Acidobacteria bacterium]|nr:MAG: hypothetical protein DMF85_21720 [Acidobacteriota bacterium]